MGEWVIGALINLLGSIAINFGTNLLKLGHNERMNNSAMNGKLGPKHVINFPSWRIGIIIFSLGNCLNFISFGYAAQSLLAALGSIQFVSNVAFSHILFNRTVTIKIIIATALIVLGNIFLVAFGNHQSVVYTPQELAEKYYNITFIIYCIVLVLFVTFYHHIYRRGVLVLSYCGHEPYWKVLIPFSFAVVSGVIGSFSVLFAKSISNLLRLTITSRSGLHGFFFYTIVFLFLCTAVFWMIRLNEGLALFDAIVIVPMFQIVWTFVSICTGFVYFQEYKVLDSLRISMFIFGMISVFVGIFLLASDEQKGIRVKGCDQV